MSTLSVKITSKNCEGAESWEGTVSIPGTKPTKLVRKSDGETSFRTRSAVMGAAKTFAENLGFSDLRVEQQSQKAAKKSVTSAASQLNSVSKKKTKVKTSKSTKSTKSTSTKKSK